MKTVCGYDSGVTESSIPIMVPSSASQSMSMGTSMSFIQNEYGFFS
ncbi:MAG: hypothetical protein AABY09_05950 [Nanoarchaeota archaeon]